MQHSNRLFRFASLFCFLAVFVGTAFVSTPALAQQTQCVPKNVLLVLDKSGSMNRGNKWNEARSALNLLVSNFQQKARFGLETFAKTPSLDAAIPSTSSAILQKTGVIRPGGDTNMVPALQRAASYLAGHLARENVPGRPTSIVLITDGAASDRCPIAEVKALRALKVGSGTQDIRTYVVAFKSSTNSKCLNALAAAGGTAGKGSIQYIFASDTRAFLAAMTELIALPNVQEQCNGLDDDCDGKVDNLKGTNNVLTGSCQQGFCVGSRTCVQGKWTACQPSQAASVEVCDGKDNDCDGFVDNLQGKKADDSLLRPCSTGCGNGVEVCKAGRWQNCSVSPKQEECNGKDDDCDGRVDNFRGAGRVLEQSCSIGGCGGSRVCSGGKWSSCVPRQQPTPEVCNGKDDNCDGLIDNAPGSRSNHSLLRRCKNLCGSGTQTCRAGIWNACNATTTKTCTGACGKGTQTCRYNQWSACSSRARTEVCDGKDNDCDGQTDENCKCTHGAKRSCGTNTGSCKKGTQTCYHGKWGRCVGYVGGKAEVCDGKDNDCDGRVDENWSSQLGTSCKAACGSGVLRCHPSGSGVYCASSSTTQNNLPERCNNRDDDCDGLVDEGLTRRCYNGAPGTAEKGTCKSGVQVCSRGIWGSCRGSVEPVVETCDGLDNDCDGSVDEDFRLGQSCQSSHDSSPAHVSTIAGASGASDVVSDSAGNLYFADARNHQIRKLSAQGVLSVLAGSGKAGSADGKGTAASFHSPSRLAIDGAGNLYVTENNSHSVRKITPAGVVSTLAGASSSGYQNGVGRQARFWNPQGLAVDAAGNVYVADSNNNRIRKISPSGVVSTLAGNGRVGRGNGTAASASFSNPSGVAVSSRGEVFVADTGNHSVRKIFNGVVSTVAGLGVGGFKDGFQALFRSPVDVAVDGFGNLYIADRSNHRIRKILHGGEVVTLAGNGTSGSADGLGSTAQFSGLSGLFSNTNGTVFVADAGKVRKVATSSLTGPCSKGVFTCQGGRAVCVSRVKPRSEVCDGKDNDCDGEVDEDWPNKGSNCYTGLGFCQAVGVFRCAASGQGVQCTAKQTRRPAQEVCDAVDNDCDGQTDEGLTRSCNTSCGAGTQTCNEGSWGSCSSATKPSAEICDGKDNDCDGSVDENFPTRGKPCFAGTGACQNGGSYVCTADGKGVRCNATPKAATAEICDGLDNDCDGLTDEGLRRECSNGCGQKGKEYCQNGKWDGCDAPAPKKEVCNGKDDDCNGKTDDLPPRACRNACGQGTTVCEGGQWTSCQPSPKKEVCNGKDDDCDGLTDEGLVKPCTGPCGLGVRVCREGNWGTCKPKAAKPELCNGLDDNCDGEVDNGAKCRKGQTCQDGKCRKACKDNDDCPVGEVCTDGVCGPSEKPAVLERTKGDGGTRDEKAWVAPSVGCLCQTSDDFQMPLGFLFAIFLLGGLLRKRTSTRKRDRA